MWNWYATHQDEASYLPPEKLTVLHDAVIGQCDALDRVIDGVIENPRICTFDPAVTQCTGAQEQTLKIVMSALSPISSALPPGADVIEACARLPVLTHNGHRSAPDFDAEMT